MMLASRLLRHGFARAEKSLRERIFRRVGWDMTRPAFVQCVLTERCNYKCQYCSHWRMEKYSDEMSLAEWQATIGSLKELAHPLVIDFTGGEPTIYPNFLEVVEFCRSIGVDWFMTTNGSMLTKNRFVKRLVAAQPLKIDVSVDSSLDKIHDHVRGVPGSLARIDDGLRALVSERERTSRNFAVRIKVTVHKLNAGRLAPIVKWAEDIGATSVDFNHAGGLWREEQIEQLAIRSPSDLAVLRDEIQKLLQMKSDGRRIETSQAGLLRMIEHFSGSVEFGAAPCRDPVRNFIVNPRGDVRGCGCSPSLGNVRERSARHIWQGEAAKATRLKSLGCSLQVAKTGGTSSCMAEKTIMDDVRRAALLLGFRSGRVL